MIVPFVMAGAGMALVFAPSANAVLSSVRADQAGQASGANNAIREVGGVLGVAVLASVFTGSGGYASPQAFVDGLHPGHLGRRRGARAPARSSCSLLPFEHAAVEDQVELVTGDAAAAGARRGAERAGGLRRRSPSRRAVAALAPVAARAGRGRKERVNAATKPARRRVPAAERREELIAAAVHEFAHGGLHGTPVERIARRVGVAQPYVFSLFPSKRDLFLAALRARLRARRRDVRARRRRVRRGGTRAEDCEDALDGDGPRLQGAAARQTATT